MAPKRKLLHLATGALLMAGLTACDASPQAALGALGKQLGGLIAFLRGGSAPTAPVPAPRATPPSFRALGPDEAAQRARENAERLQEVLRVVYDREPGSRAEFGTLVDSMNQGASIEGLYNGFTHSSDYRKLEVENPGATSGALSFFASELALTESQLHPPTQFGPDAAKPLALPETPQGVGSGEDAGSGTAVSEIDFGKGPGPAPSTPPAAAPTVATLEAAYLKTFSGASIYTLKRVLGDEILRLIDEKSRNPKALQAWYGAWVVRMCATNVDFGLPQRNLADPAFHARWAAAADPDHLKWEVLNRVHRILNARERMKP